MYNGIKRILKETKKKTQLERNIHKTHSALGEQSGIATTSMTYNYGKRKTPKKKKKNIGKKLEIN